VAFEKDKHGPHVIGSLMYCVPLRRFCTPAVCVDARSMDVGLEDARLKKTESELEKVRLAGAAGVRLRV
jgi:hypothetical protein